MARLLPPLWTVLDSNQDGIGGALVFFFEIGTTTKKTTFSDSALTTANSNPIVCDANGRLTVDVFGTNDADYKIVVAPSGDTDPPTSPLDTFEVLIGAGAANFIFATDFGLGVVGTTDAAAIQAAIDHADSLGGGTVILPIAPASAPIDLLTTAIIFPNGGLVYLVGQGQGATFVDGDVTGAMFKMGVIGTTNFQCGISRMSIRPTAIAGGAIELFSATRTLFEDLYIEGLFSTFDNTRTNFGIKIDGGNKSAFFNTFINVICNHLHTCFHITTTGTLQATDQHFYGCTAFADSATDTTGKGYLIDGSVAGSGDGTIISGGNIEKCATGIELGTNAGSISVATRFEITASLDAINTNDAANRVTVFGGSGLTTAGMLNGPGTFIILNTEQGTNSVFVGAPTAAEFAEQFAVSKNIGFQDDNIDHRIYFPSGDGSSTGSITMQAGGISADFGAFMRMNSKAQASRPGDFECGPSSADGDFIVTDGIGGTALFTVSGTAATKATLLNGLSVSNTVAVILSGSGTPEAAVTAPVGSIFMRTDGGAGTTFFVKESGAGNTGWVGK